VTCSGIIPLILFPDKSSLLKPVVLVLVLVVVEVSFMLLL